jgi:hypothetical protein
MGPCTVQAGSLSLYEINRITEDWVAPDFDADKQVHTYSHLTVTARYGEGKTSWVSFDTPSECMAFECLYLTLCPKLACRQSELVTSAGQAGTEPCQVLTGWCTV